MAERSLPASEREGAGRGFGPLARLLLWLGIISLAFIVVVIIAPINPWFPEATKEAGEVDALFKFMLAASGVIFIYVQGLLLDFALRYRRRKSDSDDALGSSVHENTKLEVFWSVVPALLLLILAVFSLQVWGDEHAVQHNPVLLNVKGYQFGWSFRLPQYGLGWDKNLSTVTIPVNRPVYVTEQSPDVIHSFWVPEFRIKQDVVPGLHTHEEFTPIETGTFPVICTEFCGSGHSGMVTTITVASPAHFAAWVRKNGGAIPRTSHSTTN